LAELTNPADPNPLPEARRPAKGKGTMQIGDFARLSGLSVRAVRYYEELGLLRPEAHSGGGFRLYGSENLKRIRVVKFLKDLGLSLTEIRGILLAKKPGGGDQETVRRLTRIFEEKLTHVESRLEYFSRMKLELSEALRMLRRCRDCDHAVLLDAIACRDCDGLHPREGIPETFEVILQ